MACGLDCNNNNNKSEGVCRIPPRVPTPHTLYNFSFRGRASSNGLANAYTWGGAHKTVEASPVGPRQNDPPPRAARPAPVSLARPRPPPPPCDGNVKKGPPSTAPGTFGALPTRTRRGRTRLGRNLHPAKPQHDGKRRFPIVVGQQEHDADAHLRERGPRHDGGRGRGRRGRRGMGRRATVRAGIAAPGIRGAPPGIVPLRAGQVLAWARAAPSVEVLPLPRLPSPSR